MAQRASSRCNRACHANARQAHEAVPGLTPNACVEFRIPWSRVGTPPHPGLRHPNVFIVNLMLTR